MMIAAFLKGESASVTSRFRLLTGDGDICYWRPRFLAEP
jgi:hypothetical protein